jgi:hypothetical protein
MVYKRRHTFNTTRPPKQWAMKISGRQGKPCMQKAPLAHVDLHTYFGHDGAELASLSKLSSCSSCSATVDARSLTILLLLLPNHWDSYPYLMLRACGAMLGSIFSLSSQLTYCLSWPSGAMFLHHVSSG